VILGPIFFEDLFFWAIKKVLVKNGRKWSKFWQIFDQNFLMTKKKGHKKKRFLGAKSRKSTTTTPPPLEQKSSKTHHHTLGADHLVKPTTPC